jgi:hypothetical protein
MMILKHKLNQLHVLLNTQSHLLIDDLLRQTINKNRLDKRLIFILKEK